MGRLFSGFGALQKCGFPIYELQIKLCTLGLGDQEPFGGFLMCELLTKLASFWLGGTRTLLDQPANQPAPQSASQPAKRKTGLFYPRSASLGLFGPLCPMVGPTNGRSNGPMVRPMVGPMAQWSVQWSNGRSNGPMVGPMVSPMIQWPVQGSNRRSPDRSNGPIVAPMAQWSVQ